MRPETRLQREIKAHLEAKGLRIVASANGAVLAGNPKQRAIQMNSLKGNGLCVGFPDITVYGDGRRIGHIEVKLEGEKQSDRQIECQGWLESFGHSYAVCRSIADVDETLAEWGWVKENISTQPTGSASNQSDSNDVNGLPPDNGGAA